ncbi:MAG: hypothetical protein KC457_18415 [Myxococcales bacterium]|nr:hypothetical protein [Myxococcales bacterium]
MDEQAVTVVVTRRVRRGCEPRYQQWLERLINDASLLPGFVGAHVQPPGPGEAPVYTSVFRFDNVEHLRGFESSELRRRALAEVTELVEEDAVWRRFTGLELWFTPPAGTVVPQPSRFRMALVMIAVVYGLVLSIGALVSWALAAVPGPVRLLITISLEVFLMTYVLMPRLTRWLARWIYPEKETT